MLKKFSNEYQTRRHTFFYGRRGSIMDAFIHSLKS